jgi:hypothetical protein
MIDVWCTLEHYAAHLRPLWDALPAEARGRWYDCTDDPEGGEAILVGAWRDANWISMRYSRTALVEHGIGQTYSDSADHPGYPGGIRAPYDLLLAPGRHVRDPAARETVYIGCPKIERWRGSDPSRSRAAVSFHWDCGISPEAGSTFWEYLPHLERQGAQTPGGLLVHAHPRIQFDVFEQICRMPNIEICPEFDRVLEEAAVYAVDNSSTLFEFAALDRPVVVINGARYRRGVQHGKRFWEWADIGQQINGPEELAIALRSSREDDPHAERRREIIAACYEGNTADGVAALLRLCR